MKHATFQRSRTVLVRQVGDEMILLDTDAEAYFSLDAVGALVYDTFRRPSTLPDAVDAVLGSFDVERERAEVDVTALINDLVARKMLEPIPSDG